jgi:hypothetical protein
MAEPTNKKFEKNSGFLNIKACGRYSEPQFLKNK